MMKTDRTTKTRFPGSTSTWLWLFALGCAGCLDTGDPGMLVPPTADQDPSLPQVALEVAGHTRAVHVRTFGEPGRPVILVLHGSLGDSRPYLPLQALSDHYFVVLWDQRGNGLSERITEEELSWDSVVEEIDAIKALYSPDRPVSLIGHSWGAAHAAMYLGQRPESVHKAVLLEPLGLRAEFSQAIIDQTLNIFTEVMADEVWLNDILAPVDHESLDYKALLVLESAVLDYYCDNENLPPWPVWRAGGYVEILHNRMITNGGRFDYDFTDGLAEFPRKVLLVGSECSTIGWEFQEAHHRPLFRDAEVLRVPNAGHRLLTEQFETVLRGVRSYLEEGGVQ